MAWIIAAHAALPPLTWLVRRAPATTSGNLLRGCYPVILLLGLYSALDILNGFGAVPVHDGIIQQLEAGLFGQQPARDWWRQHPSAFWSSLLHATYLSYYLIVPAPLIYLAAARRWDEMTGYLNRVISVFLLCYLCYVLWPVAGPYYAFARPSGDFVANLPARMVYAGLAQGSSFGAAFPSSHVAATIAAAIGGWWVDRRLGGVLIAVALLLAVAVVYCQMHYVIDSVTGLGLGLSVSLLMHRREITARQ